VIIGGTLTISRSRVQLLSEPSGAVALAAFRSNAEDPSHLRIQQNDGDAR
jgi:hypothetical protein